MKLLFIWLTKELDAMYARRISVSHVTPSHITWVNCVDKLMPKVADSAKKNSSNHLQVWSQRSEMFVEKESASTWCRNLAIKYWIVDIHVLDQLEKSNACHALNLNALQKCRDLWNQPLIKMNSVRSAIAPVWAKNHAFNSAADTFSTSTAWRKLFRTDTTVLV